MIVPTVHLNGTSKRELERQFTEAYQSLDVAYAKMRHSAPNGRDYYVQGPDAIDQAMKAHKERLLKIADVMDEFEKLANAVDSQGK